ncbi:MAG: lysophospholipid acyltransferase family protein [Bacteroidales bacterium]|nr:lysophospholipid acyltransferase family protein [Bacteroidales bacterium]
MERYIIPRKVALAWHSLLIRIAYPFLKPMQKRIHDNLTLAYGDQKSDQEKYQIGKNILVNLVKTFTDYAWWSQKKTRAEFLKYFTIEGEEHLKAAYERGKGVLCLIPHTCGWEFSAILPPILGYETSAVSSKIKNPALNRFMIEKRESRGMKNFSRQDHCYDKLIEALKNGDCMIIMIDQDSLNIRGEFLDFFGHPAYTPLGCARMAMDSGAAIVPMATIRLDDDHYLFKILPEIPMEITGDKDYDIKHNTQIHNNVIESIVREYPDQWIWMHKRWNTTPEILAVHLENRRKRKERLAAEQNKENAKS